MKGRLLCLLLAVLTLGGCWQRQEGTAYAVYYRPQAAGQEAALAAESRPLPAGKEPVEGLLELLLSDPQQEDLTRAIPAGVTLRRWAIHNGLLTVDFSGSYGALSGVALTLADYSVVLTLTQLEEVEAVMITVDGEMPAYRDHQRLRPEDAWLALVPEG